MLLIGFQQRKNPLVRGGVEPVGRRHFNSDGLLDITLSKNDTHIPEGHAE